MRHSKLLASSAIAIAAVAIASCSGSSNHTGMGGGMGDNGHHPSQNQNTPRKAGQFRLTEWTITADSKQLRSGSQTITALNTGHHTHELVIVKAADAASLPTKSDGSVDEKALKNRGVGEIEDVAAGSSKHATFDLAAGSYVAFCNITDSMGMGGMEHNHFELGMHTTFDVRSDDTTDADLQDRQSAVEARGSDVMPFDQAATTHIFAKTKHGGIETVTANDASDAGQAALIRMHLRHEAQLFTSGDFSDPAAIHGKHMPGLAALERGASHISFTYAEAPGGATITYRTADTVLVAALHTWFDAQTTDHGQHAHS